MYGGIEHNIEMDLKIEYFNKEYKGKEGYFLYVMQIILEFG